MNKTETKITEELNITDERGFELMVKVLQYCRESRKASDVLKRLLCDFELDHKELVLSCFYLGKLQNENLDKDIIVHAINDVVSKMLNSK
jgi:hypothetical protein